MADSDWTNVETSFTEAVIPHHKVFVVHCPRCQQVVAGYDAEMGNASMMGESIRSAAKNGWDIGFRIGTVQLGSGCICKRKVR